MIIDSLTQEIELVHFQCPCPMYDKLLYFSKCQLIISPGLRFSAVFSTVRGPVGPIELMPRALDGRGQRKVVRSRQSLNP